MRLKSKELVEMSLNDIQKQMILGSLMGDMSIKKGNSPNHNFPRLRVHHSVKQMEYVQWKYNILKNVVSSEPKVTENSSNFGKFLDCSFTTRSLPCLEPIYDLVVKNGKRKLSQRWLDEINDPLAIATWYMDDGSLVKHKYRVGKEDQRIIGHSIVISMGKDRGSKTVQKWLSREWGIESIHRWNGKEYIISIHRRERIDEFLELVSPHANVECMRHKMEKDWNFGG